MAVIRKSKPNDVEHIVRLWKELADHLKDAERGFTEFVPEVFDIQMKYQASLIDAEDKISLVAENDNGQIIGFLAGSVSDRPPVFIIKKQGVIGDICVTKTYRHQGIGKALVKEFEAWAKEKGAEFVVLGVLPENESGIEFWHNMGYNDTAMVFKRKFI